MFLRGQSTEIVVDGLVDEYGGVPYKNLMDMTTMRQRLASVSDTPAFLHDDKIVQTYPLTSENHQESKKKKTCLYHRVEEHVISQRKSILHGRDREIQGLKSGFWGDTPDKAKWMEVTSLILQVVTGLGGIGKSSLATHYAVEMREAYSGGVFFFNAVSCAALHDSVIQNMAVLSLKTDGLRKKVLEDNSLLLSHIRSRSKVLFIYDAVEDFDFLEKVLPPDNMAVHVLVTTRFGGDHRLLHSRACRIIRLGYLSPEDAKSALLSWARHENQSDEELEYSMKLVARLQVQGLPLAIAHIGTAVRQQNMSFRVYYELLESEKKKLEAAALNMDKLLQYFHVSNLREELAKAHINKPHELQEISSAVIDHVTTNPAEKLCIQKAQHWMNESSHVYLTWQFDIDTLRNKSRDAMEVLEYASLLSPKNIPGRVLQEMAFEMNDRRKLNKSIFDLSSHSLINEAKRNDMCTYDVHALVQLTVFHRLMIEKQNGNLDIKLSKLCRYLLRETAVGRENIEHKLKNCAFQQLLPHIYSVAEKVLMCGVQGDVYFNFVQNACWIALTAGHVDSADHLCRKQMKMTNWDGTDGYHVTALLQCGELYLDLLQQPSDAESYFSTAKQLLGLENCETDNIIISEHSHCAGTVLNGLARCHQEQHRYDSAEKMYLSVMKQDGCEGNVVTAMANLGLLYNVTGHLDKAIDMCQQALRKAPKNSTLASLIMNNFGRCLIDSGEFSEAAEILEQSLAITRRWKPDDHRDVAIVLKLLSICYVSLQNSSKAKQMAEESLCIIQSVVERRHRLLAPYISQLAECCNSLGDLDNCIEYKEQVVEIHRQHPVSERDLCAALTSLSMSYINKRMISEALATLKECVSMPEAFLSQQHFAQS
jgi:tetratricopeptide (TPR) repeat protein